MVCKTPVRFPTSFLGANLSRVTCHNRCYYGGGEEKESDTRGSTIRKRGAAARGRKLAPLAATASFKKCAVSPAATASAPPATSHKTEQDLATFYCGPMSGRAACLVPVSVSVSGKDHLTRKACYSHLNVERWLADPIHGYELFFFFSTFPSPFVHDQTAANAPLGADSRGGG